MIRLSVVYPNAQGKRFDFGYYADKHVALAKKLLAPYGLVRIEIDKAISGPMGAPAPFACTGHLYFNAIADLQAAMQAHAGDLLADIPNYTDIQPNIQISEVLTP